MTGEDQTLTVTYETADGTTATKDFNLKFYPYAGVFRFPSDPAPQLPDLVVDITPTPLPDYDDDPIPGPNPNPDPNPDPCLLYTSRCV